LLTDFLSLDFLGVFFLTLDFLTDFFGFVILGVDLELDYLGLFLDVDFFAVFLALCFLGVVILLADFLTDKIALWILFDFLLCVLLDGVFKTDFSIDFFLADDYTDLLLLILLVVEDFLEVCFLELDLLTSITLPRLAFVFSLFGFAFYFVFDDLFVDLADLVLLVLFFFAYVTDLDLLLTVFFLGFFSDLTGFF